VLDNSQIWPIKAKHNNNNNNNKIQFFIISMLHQQPEGQLQMQHKG
jgi:hypothetical protein